MCVYEPAGWQSTFQVLLRKSETVLGYMRRGVAALVHRELKKKYIENSIEHVWGRAEGRYEVPENNAEATD